MRLVMTPRQPLGSDAEAVGQLEELIGDVSLSRKVQFLQVGIRLSGFLRMQVILKFLPDLSGVFVTVIALFLTFGLALDPLQTLPVGFWKLVRLCLENRVPSTLFQ